MSDDDHERSAAFGEQVEAVPHEKRADALALTTRKHRHRSQSHPDNAPASALDRHRREQDVADDRLVLGDERQRVGTPLPQPLHQTCLERLAERQLVHLSDLREIAGRFRTDGDQLPVSSAKLTAGSGDRKLGTGDWWLIYTVPTYGHGSART